MVYIIEIFNSNTDIETKLLGHIHDHESIFGFIDYVFENPTDANIDNLNHLYIYLYG